MNTPTLSASSAATPIRGFDVEQIGLQLSRYGLVLVLLWIGGMKFTTYEANGIKPMVENSPLMFFVYHFLSVGTFSAILGAFEILAGLMIAARPISAMLSAAGSLLGICMFLTTLTFIISTPGAFEPTLGGFPALSINGQFLLKDVVLLGASVLTCGEALKGVTRF